MRRTPARRVERGSALWRGFLSCGSSGSGIVRSLSDPRRKVQLPHIIQRIKPAGKLATTYVEGEQATLQMQVRDQSLRNRNFVGFVANFDMRQDDPAVPREHAQ